MTVKDFKCTQCGAVNFTEEGKEKLRCNYCESLYFIEDKEENRKSSGGFFIKKGAKVTFGKNANVVIKGKFEIEDGAEVELNGHITLIEKSSEEKIQRARLKLMED